MNIFKILSFFLVVILLSCCSGDSGEQEVTKSNNQQVAKSRADRAAEMEELLRQTELFAKQEKERRKKKIETWERPLIIGVVGPESGENANYGKSVVKGVLAAAKRFNAGGGINGKEIKVLHFDDESKMAFADEIVTYLINQGAIAILSAPTGSSTFTPVHLVNETKTIFISIGSRRHIERSGPYVFRSAVPDELATEDLIRYASEELSYVNYALVTSSNHPFSLALSSLFKKAVYHNKGVIKVEADVYDTYTGKSDMGKVIDAIRKKAKELDGVIFTGNVSEGVLLAKGLKKAGLSLPIIGGEDLYSDEYMKGGKAVEGTLLYSTLSSGDKSSRMADFIEDYGKENKPDRFAALAYDTFMLVADAIKRAGSTNTAKVREALISRKDCEGVTGKTSFSSEGEPIKHPLICKIKTGKNGGRVVVLKQ
jgi:branched-chain amino acid transport system substrate-binding protein